MSLVGSVLRAMGRGITKAARKGLFKEEPNLFVADFTVTVTYASPAGIFDHDDLLLIVTETKNGHPHLVTFWKDENSFNQVETEFRHAAGLGGAHLTRRIAKGPSPPRWRWDWVKFPAVVWSLISALGIGGWLLGFFTAPDFGAVSADVPRDMVVGKAYDLKFDLVNRHPTAEARAKLSQIKFVPVRGGKEHIPDATLDSAERRVAGNAKETIVVQASAASIDQVGQYTLKLSGTAHAGWLRGSPPLELDLGPTVKVWPKLRYHPDPALKSDPQPLLYGATVLVAHYELESGLDFERGIDIEAFLMEPAEAVVLHQANFLGVTVVRGKSLSLRWHTPPIVKFTVSPFSVTLVATKEQKNWNNIISRLTIRLPNPP